MKDKEIIERKLEIFLKEHEESKERTEKLGDSILFLKSHEESKERTKRLSKIIKTYAGRYRALTGKYYVRRDFDPDGYYK